MSILNFKLKHWILILLLLPLCYACNNDNNNSENAHSSFSNIGIKIAVIDQDGNEAISKLKTIMPKVENYWYDDSSKGLNPQDYTLDIYMDGLFLHSLTNPTEQIDWPIVREPYEKLNCPWWSITLPGYHAGKKMVKDESQYDIHSIEYHMTYEALFGDSETHIIRFDFKHFGMNRYGFYANAYFDDEELETYYPEIFKLEAEKDGYKMDIEEKYWIEGASGWPIAIIKFKKTTN